MRQLSLYDLLSDLIPLYDLLDWTAIGRFPEKNDTICLISGQMALFISIFSRYVRRWITFTVSKQSVIPPLHRGCDLCASLVRPQNWPGRRWRQKGGRTVALVVQGLYTGRSDIAMDAMVAVKFWACSKQSHKGRRGGRSLTGRSKEAGWRHTHRRGRRMDAQWSAIGRPVKNANIVYQFEQHVCLPCTTIVPPLADQWRPLSDHCGDHCASIQRPWQPLSHHGNGSAFTLPSLRDLQQLWSFKEGTRVVLQQLHRNRTFWVPATTERPNHFYGRTKVARRS